jgi:DNA polymerase (family 10)
MLRQECRMNNREMAAVFTDIAGLLERKKDNIFKIRAYCKAAAAIESLSVDIGTLVAGGRLQEVAGVGEAIEKKIAELVITGRLEYYDRLKREFTDGEQSTDST